MHIALTYIVNQSQLVYFASIRKQKSVASSGNFLQCVTSVVYNLHGFRSFKISIACLNHCYLDFKCFQTKGKLLINLLTAFIKRLNWFSIIILFKLTDFNWFSMTICWLSSLLCKSVISLSSSFMSPWIFSLSPSESSSWIFDGCKNDILQF